MKNLLLALCIIPSISFAFNVKITQSYEAKVSDIKKIMTDACANYGQCDNNLKSFVTDYWLIKSYVLTNKTASSNDIANAIVQTATHIDFNSSSLKSLNNKMAAKMLLAKPSKMKECMLDAPLSASVLVSSGKKWEDFLQLKSMVCAITVEGK